VIKQAPSLGRILTMVAFALSCFGILVFLWLSFGGSVPLKPKGYRVEVGFPEATQLAKEAEVRISGVKVGRVKTTEPNKQTGLTDTVIEIDARYAPLPKDTRAILRQKTLLGETYVELSPGGAGIRGGGDESKMVPDGGHLAEGQVAETVQLDEILRTFDPVTRQRFSTWLDQQGLAVRGQAEAISNTLALLTPFAENTDDVLKVLRAQSGATRAFVRDTGEVFTALSERKGQLRGLIGNANRVWTAIASRNEELADTFRVFPTFLREGRATTARATSFAKDANPLIDQLRPAARQISPALVGLDKLSPDLRSLFKGLGPFVSAARKGLPATEQVLNNTRPILRRLDPYLRNLTPIFDYLGAYKSEIAAFFANDSAATQLRSQPINKAVPGPLTESGNLHVLRTLNPMNPEIMAGFPTRLATNRSNPYTVPGAYKLINKGSQLPVFGSYVCGTTPVPDAPAAVDPYWPQSLVDRVNQFVYGDPDNRGAAPPCVAQGSLGQILNQSGVLNAGGEYPRLQPLP
jgi:phospholipid/cholesterol/gamma-HCH transport system substrate-binding protein